MDAMGNQDSGCKRGARTHACSVHTRVNALSGQEWRHGTHECVRHNHVSRRNFLAAASATTAAAFAPSEKMNIAIIGIAGGYGNRAFEELSSQNIVAICDVDWRTREQQGSRFVAPVEVAARHPEARRFDDWRKMLEEMDRSIDGIVICTPDHTHSVAAI